MTQAHRRAVRWVVPGYALILAVTVTAPLLAPGYLLLRDAVSTPRSFFSDAALGLTEAAPRAVPQDFLIAALTSLVDGGLVVKVLLIGGVFLAGWGAARLAAVVVPDAGVAGQLVAVTLAVWNPYVTERLLQGHWSLLLGYGCLPWTAAAVVRLRSGETDPWWAGWAAVVFWIGLAGLTPTGMMLAATVALVCVAVAGPGVPRARCAAGIVATSVLAAMPWLAASALGGALGTAPSSGLAAFAARAEPGLGTLGSLAGLGGIWNAEAVPSSRTTLLALVATAVLLAVVAIGLPTVIRRPAAVPLLVLAAVSIVAPAAMATGPGLAALQAVVEAAPGLGVLRDGQKWVALAMPGYAVAAAAAVVTTRGWLRPGLVALACVTALIAVLPDLAWGVWNTVTPVRYPPGWAAVAEAIDADPGPVAVLPADSMRRFGWAGPSPVLDPLPRWVRAEVLTTGDLTISGQTVPGEGGRAREVQRMLVAGARPQELAGAGVRWVVVEGGSAGAMGNAHATLQHLPVAYRDGDLTLYRVGGSSPVATQGKRTAMVVAHAVWVALLAVSAAALATGARRRTSSCTIWYMMTSGTVSIDAPADLVWNVFTDVEHWPEWTASVTRLVGLDGPDLADGRRFEIDQPRLPKLRWEVTDVVPHSSWTWVQRSPGGVTTARHDVVATAEGTTVVSQELDQRGIVGAAVAVLMRRTTKRYLAMEGQGLKARCEGLWKLRGPAT